MKIAIAVPSHDTVPALFSYDLAQLCLWTASQLPEGVHLGLYWVSGTYVHKARQELIDHLLEVGTDYILWIDSDMRFPKEALVGLMQRKRDVVGINYAKRCIPSEYVAIKKAHPTEGEPCVTNEDSEGLEEVDAVGFGMVLMRCGALSDLPDPSETPWFQHKHLGGARWVGEDVHFCELLREAGVKIWVDHDLSKACAHSGVFDFRLDHVLAPVEAA